jgi:hypothetical protein
MNTDLTFLWKESLSFDGQQFHKYQQNELSPFYCPVIENFIWIEPLLQDFQYFSSVPFTSLFLLKF